MFRSTTALLVASALYLTSPPADAQLQPLEEGIAIGEWTFYPSLDLRLRGEYRRNPHDTGGRRYQKDAVQAEAFNSTLPEAAIIQPNVADQYVLSERARLGLKVNYEVVTAHLELQDARVLGLAPDATATGFGSFGPYQAYIDVRTDVEDPWLWVRAGRQRVRWGDGRLVGDSDWSPRGRSLDALRFHFDIGPVDVELMAAVLAFPIPIAPPHIDGDPRQAISGGVEESTGAQLYGLDATWPIHPLFGVELTALARIARDPLPRDLTRSDTYTLDARLFGDKRGIEYAVEGAYQLGRIASFGFNQDISAFAAAARFAWQTALPWHFRFGARGSYASGDDGEGDTFKRFDPILPTVHEHHGMMDLYGWSNIIDGGADVSARPHDILSIGVGYTFVALAEAKDRWSSAYLIPIGADLTDGAQVLGHEIDTWLRVSPWDQVSFAGGYGLFVLGGRGEEILVSADRAPLQDNLTREHDGLLHYGFVQAEVRAP